MTTVYFVFKLATPIAWSVVTWHPADEHQGATWQGVEGKCVTFAYSMAQPHEGVQHELLQGFTIAAHPAATWVHQTRAAAANTIPYGAEAYAVTCNDRGRFSVARMKGYKDA